MNRRDFFQTSAGMVASLLAPGLWSCRRTVAPKHRFRMEPFESPANLAPVLRVTPAGRNFVQTYFDVTPFSPSQRFLSITELPFHHRIPKLGETADVCVIDLQEETIETVYTTRTWGFQTGSNVQWGRSDRYLYTNDLINGQAVAVEIDLESHEIKAMDASMYNISREGSYAIGFPVELLNVTQQGYGMPSSDIKNPPRLPAGAAEDQGIWRTDLRTYESRLLYSVADVARAVPEPAPREDGTFYFWHSKYNPQVTRIMQVLRCIFPGYDQGSDRNPMVFTLGAQGGDIRFTGQDPVWGCTLGGHPNWHPDGEHIIRNVKPDGGTTRVCQVRYDGSNFEPLSDSFASSGHPSIEPTGRFVITDKGRPSDSGGEDNALILLDLIADEPETICTIPTIDSRNLTGAMKTLRLGGHPCWSRDYRRVTIQGTHAGFRQLYIVDLSSLVS